MAEYTYKANNSTVKLQIEGLVELPMLYDLLCAIIGNMSREVSDLDIEATFNMVKEKYDI